jgi:hypothetical protein
VKLIIPVFLAAIFLVSCEKIEGQFNITKELKLINSKDKTHLLKMGTYTAELLEKSSKKIILRLSNDNNEKFIFAHDIKFPENGSFIISSKTSGQPVDLLGTISTIVTNSDISETTQSCSYQAPVQICFPIPQGGVSCSIQYQTVFGNQWIKYYDSQTSKNINLSLRELNATEESAEFHGDITYTDRIIINQSICR